MKKILLLLLFWCGALGVASAQSDCIPTFWSGISYSIKFDGSGGITPFVHPAYNAPYHQPLTGRSEVVLSVTRGDSLLFGSNFISWDPTPDPWAQMQIWDLGGRIESGWGHNGGDQPSVSSAHGGMVFPKNDSSWIIFGTGSVENWSTQGLFSTEVSLGTDGVVRIDSGALTYMQPVNAWTANPVTSPFHYAMWHKRWNGKVREPLGGLQNHYGRSYIFALAYGQEDSLLIAQIDSNGLSPFINLGSIGVRLHQPQFIEVSPDGQWVVTHSLGNGAGVGALDPIFIRLTEAMEIDTVIIGGQAGKPHVKSAEWGNDGKLYFVDNIHVCKMHMLWDDSTRNLSTIADTLGTISGSPVFSLEHAPGDQEVILVSALGAQAMHAIAVSENRLINDSLVMPQGMMTGFLPNVPTYSGLEIEVTNPEDSIPRDTIRWTIFNDTLRSRHPFDLKPWVPDTTNHIDPWDQVVMIGNMEYPSAYTWVLPEIEEEDSITTGIEEISQEIRLYPNPIYDSQWITIEGIKDGEVIHITDLLGRRSAPVEYYGRVSMRELPPGIYLFQVRNTIIRVLKH
jgi:hypothetical protein